MFDEQPRRRATIIDAVGLIALVTGMMASLFLLATKRQWAPETPAASEAVEPGSPAPTR